MPPLDDTQLLDAPPATTVQPQNPDYVQQYQAQPATWAYDLSPAGGDVGRSRATYWGSVYIGGQTQAERVATIADIANATTGVSSWNGRTGAVTLTLSDITGIGGAPVNSPTLTGKPLTSQPFPGTNDTQIATCNFVNAAVAAAAGVASFNSRTGAVTLTSSDLTNAGGALLDSPGLTGIPTAPTALAGTAGSQIATTQFVSNAIAGGAVVSWNGRQGAVALTLSDLTSAGGAPIASPIFTGSPTGPTPTVGDSTTKLATTAFVTNAVAAATAGVSSFNTRTGAVTLQLADVTTVGGAPLLSPVFTGTPAAPTATAGTSTTQLATTAFVANAIAGAGTVSSWNGRTGAVTLQLTDVTGAGGAPIASPTFTGTVNVPGWTLLNSSGLSQINSTLSGGAQIRGCTGIPSNIQLQHSAGGNILELLDNTNKAGVYNNIRIYNNVTGQPSQIATSGADTNRSIQLIPAGTGRIIIPTAAAGTNDTTAASCAFVQTAAAPAPNNTGRNLLDNAQFNVAQRGIVTWNTNGVYTADRWLMNFLNGDALTVQIVNATATTVTQIGDESCKQHLFTSVTGSAAAGAYSYVTQPIEDVRRLAGKTVTISFYANSSIVMKVGVNLLQHFGTGGSPSAPLWATPFTVTTAAGTVWQRFSGTITVPSVAGKTLGTADDSRTYLALWLSSGATNAAIAGNPGVQTGIVNFWGVQLEVGSVATPLDKPDPQTDLARCQRFYQTWAFNIFGYGTAAVPFGGTQPQINSMRAAPTITTSGVTLTNAASFTATSWANAVDLEATVVATGVARVYGTVILSADL